MSFTGENSKRILIADGIETVFAYNFLCYASAHLGVYIDGVLQVSGYTVDGLGDSSGGDVTFDTAPADDAIITLNLEVPYTQELDYPTTGKFPAASHERGLDLITMLCKRLKEVDERSLVAPLGGDTDEDLTLPSQEDRASNYLAFDADGNPIATEGTADATVVSSFMATVLDDADAAAARTTLGVPTLTEAGVQADNVFRVTGSSDATKRIAVEVDGLTTATTRTLTPQDRSGTLALIDEFAYANLAGSSGRVPLPVMFMQGFTYANNAGDATNDLDIAAGVCRDATNVHNMIGAALTKRSDVVWAVGDAAGMLDTGVVGNSDYYLWAIKRSDTGVVDYLCSLSSTSPTMPASYNFKRLIGWFKRVGGAIVAFDTYETDGGGIELIWDSPTLDINLANTLTTSRRTDAVKVPLNFSVIAMLNVRVVDAAGLTAILYCPDQADLTPSATVAPLGNVGEGVSGNAVALMRIRTSATGTIAARATTATVDLYAVATVGFTWARRN